MPVTVFASSKGGVAKSLSTVLLASELAARKASVVIIDADRARRIQYYADSELGLPERVKLVNSAGPDSLASEIEKAAAMAAHVIIDTEGSANASTAIAIQNADLVLIPSKIAFIDAMEARRTMAQVKLISDKSRRKIEARILLTQVQPLLSKNAKEILDQIKEPGNVMSTVIPFLNAFALLEANGGSLKDITPAPHNIERALRIGASLQKEVRDILKASMEA